ncbi:MAG: type IV pilus modification PilV family protein [Pyrinomonadaceae bacterium]|jgi:Tfp pilus assembly protein PilV
MNVQDELRLRRTRAGQRGDRNGQQGFTLIETAIAMIVMMVAGLAAASLFAYSVYNNSGASERALAMAVAQAQIEQLRTVSFDEASLNDTGGTPAPTTIESAGHTFRLVKIVIWDDATTPTRKTIRIQVTPTSAGPAWTHRPVVLITLRSRQLRGPHI